MKLKRLGAPLAILAAAAISLTACASNEGSTPSTTTAAPSNLSGTLNGIGSSAQGAAQTTWIAGFQQANPKVTVNYDPQGSGAGRTSFISGSGDFAGSDAALKDTELAGTFALCAAGTKAIDLPVYISPIAIAYNVDGVKDLKLDAATIAGIFSGAITTWNDPKIAALNSGASLPSAPITVVHRSDDSGTTQNFTDYLAANAPDVWVKNGAPVPAAQTFPFTVGDAAKGTSGVASATKNAKNSIAYIDESGSAGLSIAQLKVGSNFEKISAAGAAAVVAASPV
ncbi:MAG TPA: phosphate ABC transporter substrate-binding protein PstS, partial [Leifsonia sp.]|nr:phosphate ABC transporter substrate-binding protein PstS [Leifsonia sp.]